MIPITWHLFTFQRVVDLSWVQCISVPGCIAWVEYFSQLRLVLSFCSCDLSMSFILAVLGGCKLLLLCFFFVWWNKPLVWLTICCEQVCTGAWSILFTPYRDGYWCVPILGTVVQWLSEIEAQITWWAWVFNFLQSSLESPPILNLFSDIFGMIIMCVVMVFCIL